jgi:hypothetical protein
MVRRDEWLAARKELLAKESRHGWPRSRRPQASRHKSTLRFEFAAGISQVQTWMPSFATPRRSGAHVTFDKAHERSDELWAKLNRSRLGLELAAVTSAGCFFDSHFQKVSS